MLKNMYQIIIENISFRANLNSKWKSLVCNVEGASGILALYSSGEEVAQITAGSQVILKQRGEAEVVIATEYLKI
jgi:hypothetical protein